MTKKENKKIKVAVGMSGGVDSSVAAKILVDQGYTVIGFMMKFWSDPLCRAQRDNACCDSKSIEDAKRVASLLGIPFYVIDTREKFKKHVVDYFIEEYKNHRTPNPCVVCNEKIKFGWFLDFAKSVDCDFVATGHYARIVNDSRISNFQFPISKKKDSYSLLKGVDSSKDQSYFLYRLNQEQLSRTMLPIGGYTKNQVRAMAKKWNFPVHEKKESQEICFIADNYRDFLRRQLADNNFSSGNIVNIKGDIIGQHEGLINYTIGQRKGIDQTSCTIYKQEIERYPTSHPELGSGSLKIPKQVRNDRTGLQSNKKPLYVLGIDGKKNQLTVGEEKNLYKKEMTISDLKWIRPIDLSELKNLKVKIRYRSEEVACTAITNDHKTTQEQDSRFHGNDKLLIKFKESQRAITPGQSAVFYEGDEVLGGGIIS